MSRKSEIERKRAIMAELKKGKKPEAKKGKKAKKKVEAADVNHDGVVDEKDIEEVKKKIVKKKK